MKPSIGLFLVAVLLSPAVVRATDAEWVNNGSIVVAPNIDATNVINNGTINIFTPAPFDTSNTRNFTNSGTMNGSVGFRFDNAPRNSSGQLIGQRKLAANFHNRNGGTVAASDSLLLSGFNGSYVMIQATNVVNQGLLSIGSAGLLQIIGTNLNLSRGGMGNNSAGLIGTGSINGTSNFLSDVAIYDSYWGQTNMTFNSSTIINFFGPLLYVISPSHRVTDGTFTGLTSVGVIDPVTAAYSNLVGGVTLSVTNITGGTTNVFVPTNEVRQAAFVATSDPTNYLASIRFYPSSNITNPMQTVAIELAVEQTNVITGGTAINTIYFVDTLASETNRGTLLNVVDGTRKPANYLVSRLPVFEYFAGAPGNTAITNDFLYDNRFTNRIVSGPYAGYSAMIDNYTTRPPNIPAGTLTNLPGRIDIIGDSVDMSKARVRAEGYISVKANHLISSSNALVDCENLSYDFASTNGLLTIQNVTKSSVQRVRGDLYAWSAIWTNTYNIVTTNYDVSTNPAVLVPITNVSSVLYHTLILDASQVLGTLPVLVHNFRAKATNVVMNDSGTIVADLLINATSFTLNGNLSFSNALTEWRSVNAPTLRYFTNNGSLTMPSVAHFGDDGALPYIGFVNRGTIQSLGQTIKSTYVELAGTNIAGSSIDLIAQDAKVESGRLSAVSLISFNAGTLKFNRALVEGSSRLIFNVTNSLFDNGVSSSNTISCRDGFELNYKPATGDLLGTTLQTLAPNFALVSQSWAAVDRGATKAGFSNNVALGKLVLVPEGNDPFFVFSGVGAQNAIYVDYLDLSQLTDYANQIQIDPNLVIYYASAKLNFAPGGGQSPEEFLDGQFGGHLRWVSSYAGPNSSVDAVINGNQTIKVNKALRNSTTVDSDSDGVPNYYDLSPFDGVKIKSIARTTSPTGYAIGWDAAPNTIYRLEYKTNLTASSWTTLFTTTNSSAVTTPWTVSDTNVVSGAAQRYYRVTYSPNGL